MTYKKKIVGAFMAIVFLVPLYTQAVSIADLQAQINNLLQIVQSLQQQIFTQTSTSAPVVVLPPVVSPVPVVPSVEYQPLWCSMYAHVVLGARSTEVMDLHNAMGFSILGVSPTGYYGSLTKKAWERWCGTPVTPPIVVTPPVIPPTPPVETVKLSVNTSSGSAPLAVTFKAEAYVNKWFDQEYGTTVEIADRGLRYLDFGDGSAHSSLTCDNAISSACTAQVSHTYTRAGSYTATLFTAGYFAPKNDDEYGTRYDVATVQVYVSGSDIITQDPSDNPQCKAWYDGCNNCARSQVGGDAACTERACFQHEEAYCKEYFDDEPITFCTQEYAPVCGQPAMPTCPDGMFCTQAMPAHTTYSNLCMMNAVQATFVHSGACSM